MIGLHETSSRMPNFFLIGAPKSGTSALSSYLSAHPDVGFSDPKEPHFFCDDLIGHWPVTSIDEYLRCFPEGAFSKPAIGEGSVMYLYSAAAVKNIVKLAPNARFIVMLRNPVDAAYAFHSQMIYTFSESLFDFEDAWRAQARRMNGQCLPDFTLFDGVLQYGDIFSYADQVSRLFSHASRRNVLVLTFDEFTRNPQDAYERTLAFLGLPQHSLASYPVVNGNKTPQSRILERATQKVVAVKRKFGVSGGFGVLTLARRMNYQSKAREALSPEFRSELVEFFREDIARTSHLLGRDLSRWVAS